MADSTQKFPAWVLWMMGLLTILAAALLILAIVLGVQAGQRQLELQTRQEAAIALADAIDFQAAGDYSAALDAYKRALQLEPNNSAAREGIQRVLVMMAANPPAAQAAQPVAEVTGAQTLPTSESTATSAPPTSLPTRPVATAASAVTTASDSTAQAQSQFTAATTAFDAGRWQEAVSRLSALKQSAPTYEPERVAGLLFDAYVNLATEKDNENNLEEALAYFDKALELQPQSASVRTERDLIAKYLDVLTYLGADWPRAIALLREIYDQEPDYRDVASRLQDALVSYGDLLVSRNDPCNAVEQYTAATKLTTAASVTVKRDEAQTSCAAGGGVAGAPTANGAATPARLAETNSTAGAGAPTRLAESTATSEAATPIALANTPPDSDALRGRVLYSARDIATGRYFIAAQAAGSNVAPVILQEDAAQPALRPDGQRLLYHNMRNDMGGLAAVDPATGLLLRFTRFPEDILPSWNPQGNRYVFASNREGDRLWRIYVAWADTDGETTNLDFGNAPTWHPSDDLIAFRGCDVTGNACGLWMMNSSGGNRAPLTTVQADNRPAWSPAGRQLVFMSDGRDGNMEVYRLDLASDQVLRLTDSPALDGLPTVSPDGRWVAFVSNRDGAWKIWVVSINGGAANILAPVAGDLGDWTEQDLQWVN